MRKLATPIAGLTAVLAMTLGLILTPSSAGAAPAKPAMNARGVCSLALCGYVENAENSEGWLVATDNWPPANGNWATLYPGQGSPYRDTDGFHIAAHCWGVTVDGFIYDGGKWYKISNAYWAEIYVHC